MEFEIVELTEEQHWDLWELWGWRSLEGHPEGCNHKRCRELRKRCRGFLDLVR